MAQVQADGYYSFLGCHLNKVLKPCSITPCPLPFCSMDMSDPTQAFKEGDRAVVHARLIPPW